jgi:hypothetical protein
MENLSYFIKIANTPEIFVVYIKSVNTPEIFVVFNYSIV